MHGLGGSLADWWDNGYVEVLRSGFRLVLIDARGHGGSDKPHAPEDYDAKLMAADVTSVLDELRISRACFLGYSMGGWVGYNLARYAPDRFTALMIGGEDPYELTFEPTRQILREGMEAWVSVWEAWSGPLPAARRARVLANDPQALLATAQDRPDLGCALSSLAVPCMLFVGERDPAYRRVHDCARRIPGAKLICLPDLNHYEAENRSDLVVPYVKDFLRETVPA